MNSLADTIMSDLFRHQFRWRRWNCTANENQQLSLWSFDGKSYPSLFGNNFALGELKSNQCKQSINVILSKVDAELRQINGGERMQKIE